MYKELFATDIDITDSGTIYKTIKNYYCDSTSDLSSLPGLDTIAFGSKAYVATGEVYTLTSSGTWVQTKYSGGGGGGGGSSEVENMLAPTYNPESGYSKDDFIINQGELYFANEDIEPGEEWNPSKWTKIRFADVVFTPEEKQEIKKKVSAYISSDDSENLVFGN